MDVLSELAGVANYLLGFAEYQKIPDQDHCRDVGILTPAM